MIKTFTKLVLGLTVALLMIFVLFTAWAIGPVTVGKELLG